MGLASITTANDIHTDNCSEATKACQKPRAISKSWTPSPVKYEWMIKRRNIKMIRFRSQLTRQNVSSIPVFSMNSDMSTLAKKKPLGNQRLLDFRLEVLDCLFYIWNIRLEFAEYRRQKRRDLLLTQVSPVCFHGTTLVH